MASRPYASSSVDAPDIALPDGDFHDDSNTVQHASPIPSKAHRQRHTISKLPKTRLAPLSLSERGRLQLRKRSSQLKRRHRHPDRQNGPHGHLDPHRQRWRRDLIIEDALGTTGNRWITKKHLLAEEDGVYNGHVSHYNEIMCLESILARYVRWIHLDRTIGNDREADEVLLSICDTQTLDYLRFKGYAPEELLAWAWILISPTAERAVQRLEKFTANVTDKAGEVPSAVFRHILRADRLEAASVRVLLDCIWASYRRRYGSDADLVTSPAGERLSMSLIRLLAQNARLVLPDALDNIADLVCFVSRKGRARGTNGPDVPASILRHLSGYFNHVLAILAIPCVRTPYQSTAIQQRAQFMILQRMTEYTPHLPIKRQGFQAMLITQIAHAKTEGEKEWADYKAITWPPFKKDKTGVDVDRVFEGIFSRGRHVLERMVEAGYTLGDWEKMAQIFSGWDVDGSPTIQTRRIQPHPVHGRSPRFASGLAWARILATRTVKEAWACFLEYEQDVRNKTNGSQPLVAPYEAMLERILAPEAAPDSDAFPGDGKERYPEPTSPHDFLYVSEEPPTPGELLRRMREAGMAPSSRMIQLLIGSETSFTTVLNLLNSRPRLLRHLPVLLRVEQYHPEIFLKHVKDVSMPILVAYVKFLVRSKIPAEIFRRLRLTTSVAESDRGGMLDKTERNAALIEKCGLDSYQISDLPSPEYAQCILKLGDIEHHSAWLSILDSAARKLRIPESDTGLFNFDNAAWTRLRRVYRDMVELDLAYNSKTIEVLCDRLCDFLPAVRGLDGWSSRTVNQKCLRLVKSLFSKTVIGTTYFERLSTSEAVLTIPSPFSLLSYARVLGLANDRKGLVDLLQWMAGHASALDVKARQTLSGRWKLRSVIVITRVFLERLWDDEHFLQGYPPRNNTLAGSNQELLKRAKDIVEKVPEWNGWPTDEEARMACWVPPGSYDWKTRLKDRETRGLPSEHSSNATDQEDQ